MHAVVVTIKLMRRTAEMLLEDDRRVTITGESGRVVPADCADSEVAVVIADEHGMAAVERQRTHF